MDAADGAAAPAAAKKFAFSVKTDVKTAKAGPLAVFARGDETLGAAKKRAATLVIPLTTNKWAQKRDLAGVKVEDGAAAVAVKAEAPVKREEDGDDDAAALAAVLADAAAPAGKASASTLVIPLHEQQSQAAAADETPAAARPLLIAAAMPGLDAIADEGDKFKYDVAMRAADVDVHDEAYSNVRIEDFGLAMLRGMGWGGYSHDDEERYKKDAEPRQHRLGLGATPKPPEVYDKRGKLREGRTALNKDADKAVAAAADAPGRKWLGAQPKAPATAASAGRALVVGEVVEVTSGDFAGKRATVVAPSDEVRPNHAVLRLEGAKRKKRVSVPHRQLRLVATDELEAKPFVERADDADDDGGAHRKKPRRDDASKRAKAPDPRAGWLCAGIRVRVANATDALFRQKATVLDVVRSDAGALRGLLQLDAGGLVPEPGIKEKFLETALPKDGGRIRCVAGSHRGSCGILLQRDKKAESATVRLDDDDDIVTVKMDDVAEWVGQ
ncbi:hypothetical protein M885DRAFT_508323 [Pelagophyceae sp. CCMP2097]|nr:hypothetical protein M885DRAFT_508323 [Pelagophyceae sp. CCMP2097]|mmetsp:Transcript_979/g.3506  ORF Transcript_979/g.3506 Transcript_979/m.3506 type:complete len:499 (-) Transcript_979:98-1594(-)